MIQRINFIEKKPFILTYRKMVLLGGGLFGLAILFYGLQMVRLVSIEKRITKLTVEVTKLKAERERRLKELAGETGAAAGAQAVLIQYFDDPLSWAALLNELTSETPRSLWLTSLKSSEKADDASKRGMTINGQADEASAVTSFVKSLSDSPYFEKVILTSLKQEKGTKRESYQFAIDLGLTSQKKQAGGKGI